MTMTTTKFEQYQRARVDEGMATDEIPEWLAAQWTGATFEPARNLRAAITEGR